MKSLLFVLLFALLLLTPISPASLAGYLDDQLSEQQSTSVQRMLNNISPLGAAAGAVIASPSQVSPNYYFHWVRDAALTMNAVVELYVREPSSDLKNKYLNMLLNYIQFSNSNQKSKAISGLGEPKFYVDGTPFEKPWGRPQNDGPALRTITLLHFLSVSNFQSQMAIDTILNDLSYVENAWTNSSFDLWEETLGQHFYTMMVQRKAFIDAANSGLFDLAQQSHWVNVSKQIELKLSDHLQKGIIFATLNQNGRGPSKPSNLDAAIVLAVLHGKTSTPFLSMANSNLVNTVSKLEDSFKNIYDISAMYPSMAPAIGRYPEDTYSGGGSLEGNPWFLTTFAFAEYYYDLAVETQNSQMLDRGEAYLNRGLFHKDSAGNMSEQISRHNGYMLSADNLTWSHASYLTALWSREKSLTFFKKLKNKKTK